MKSSSQPHWRRTAARRGVVRRSPSVVRGACMPACARASVAQYAAGACVLVCGPAEKRVGSGGNPEEEKGAARVLRDHRGWWERRVWSCIREKAPCACSGAGRTEGSDSSACGVVCATTSLLRDGPVYLVVAAMVRQLPRPGSSTEDPNQENARLLGGRPHALLVVLCRTKADRPRADHGRNISTDPEYRD